MRSAFIMSILFGLLTGLPSTSPARAGKWDLNAVYAARVAAAEVGDRATPQRSTAAGRTGGILSQATHAARSRGPSHRSDQP
jgi:hypothetical protein